MFRALTNAGQTTRSQALTRARTYIYTPRIEQLQIIADKEGFGLEHTQALTCLRVFDRTPDSRNQRHAPVHPERAYLRYWAFLCAVLIEGTSARASDDAQRSRHAQARQQINTRAETCYGLYLDLALLEARLSGQMLPVEGIRITREHRIEI